MHITIKQLSSSGKDDHLVLLLSSVNDLPKRLFTKNEIEFINSEIKAKRKQLVINQYKRQILIFVQEKQDTNTSETLEKVRKWGSTSCTKLNAIKAKSVLIHTFINDKLTLAFAEGIVLSNYQFLKYRTKGQNEKNSLKSITFSNSTISKNDLLQFNAVCDATCKARDLVNEPLSFLTAEELSNQFVEMGKDAGFKVKVLNKKQIIEQNMGGLLAVNKGSIDPPTFSIMEYKPSKPINAAPYVLVGKGVVYDTGGLSLKPTPNSMDYMKCDMGGGATVAGAIYAIAKAQLPIHIIALVPATDNRPGGNAYVPGDVITMMSGTTVEVLNTDAEGRLILADALHYAKQYKPTLTLEFSTLTGAASAAIGQYGIVAMGTADEITKDELKKAGNTTYERLAEFPFWDEYDELIKSDVADIKNVGGPAAGMITAGKFLARFVDYPYMHFDIAGPAYIKGTDSYRGKYGTGVGVRLLFEFFKNKVNNNE